MLKIKDNIDLKELEKFGFKKIYAFRGNPMSRFNTCIKYLKGYDFEYYNPEDNRKDSLIYFNKKDRILEIIEEDYDKSLYDFAITAVNKLFELGLVEKVER